MRKNKWPLSMLAASMGMLCSPLGMAQLEEIVVTAQKREQSLQDVPVAVQTVSGETLHTLGVVDAADIALFAPSLNFESADEARLFNFSIRGIGTRSFSIGVEPSVSTVIDGVVYTRVGSAFDTLGDLSQVEVLAGPQGTLFGKNASAGVVNIRTKKPNMQEFEGKFDFTMAQDNERRTGLSLTGPLSDNVAYRVYVFDRSNDGNANNVFDGTDENGVEASGIRAKLEWDASDNLNFLFTGDYSEKFSNCCAMAPHNVSGSQGNSGARYNLSTGLRDDVNGYAVTTPEFLGVDADLYGTDIAADISQISEQTSWGVSLETNYTFGNDHTLTSITAYREWFDYTTRDRDSSFAQLSGLNGAEIAYMMGTTSAAINDHDAVTPAEIDAAMTALGAISYNSLDFMTNGDGRIGTNNSNEFNDTFTQEIRITSPTGGFIDYVAGLWYSDQHVQRDLTIAGKLNRNAGAITNPIESINPITGEVTCLDASCYKFGDTVTSFDTENFGAFGQVNFNITDDFIVFA
ncbi:TonB-dependent receptor plug domain-containing protein, partial [bacterium AH-315-K03]|nr:TonB-dependent receptor plug domain-containing protein [bacterium AH-315-K03]